MVQERVHETDQQYLYTLKYIHDFLGFNLPPGIIQYETYWLDFWPVTLLHSTMIANNDLTFLKSRILIVLAWA